MHTIDHLTMSKINFCINFTIHKLEAAYGFWNEFWPNAFKMKSKDILFTLGAPINHGEINFDDTSLKISFDITLKRECVSKFKIFCNKRCICPFPFIPFVVKFIIVSVDVCINAFDNPLSIIQTENCFLSARGINPLHILENAECIK